MPPAQACHIYGMATNFTPTFLYIKRHTKTNLHYFGKTQRNPETYIGSGVRWLNHIRVHGKDLVETVWYCLFVDPHSLAEFAANFSKSNAIAESVAWANLIPETGVQYHHHKTDPGVVRQKIKDKLNSPDVIRKRTQTLMARYGVDNGGKTIQSRDAARERMRTNNPRHSMSNESLQRGLEARIKTVSEMSPSERKKFASYSFAGKTHSSETKQLLAQKNSVYSYLIISPGGDHFSVRALKSFCIQHALNRDIFRKFINKGKIPPAPSGSSETRRNSEGWEIRLVD